MNDNVTDFTGDTYADIPVEKVLERAKTKNLEDVILIGCREDGSYYFASSTSDSCYMNWLLDAFKYELMTDHAG